MGVGLHFDAKNQGASIISEIKKSYPSKIVIAYTGASMASAVARNGGMRADELLRKDVDIEEWILCLDRFVTEAVDPFVIWNKTRARLIELDADTKTILSLEDAYVQCVLGRDSSFVEIRTVLASEEIRGDVRSIIQGLIASVIFKTIFGA